jgi:hypothetical protein
MAEAACDEKQNDGLGPSRWQIMGSSGVQGIIGRQSDFLGQGENLVLN